MDVVPGTRGISTLRPESADSKSGLGPLQVANTQPSEIERMADTLLIDEAMFVSHFLVAVPRELADDPIRLLEDRCAECVIHQNM